MEKTFISIAFVSSFALSAFFSMPAFAENVNVPLQIPISGKDAITVCVGEYCSGIAEYIALIYKWLVGFAAILAVLAITWGGVQWLISGGESGKIQEARKVIGNAIIGLLLALGSYAILYTINPKLVQYDALSIKPIKKIELTLEEFKDVTPDPDGNPPHTPKRIILHHSGGDDEQAGCNLVRTIEGKEHKVDCHYWVKTNGEVIRCLNEEAKSSFCQGGANSGSIGIEIVGTGNNFTEAQLTSTANLVKAISSKNNIPLNNQPDTDNGFKNQGGVFTHATICALIPGSTRGKWDILEKYQKIIIENAGGTFYPGKPACNR